MVLALLLAFAGCDKQRAEGLEKFRAARELMGTIVQVDICASRASKGAVDQALKDVWTRLEDIHWRMSVFNDKSDVNKINNLSSGPVKVQGDTYWLLMKSKRMSELTDGLFDITVWPLIKEWKEAMKKGKVPDHERLVEIRKDIGMKNIILLDNDRVNLLNKGTKIDLGGIAKGYAIDEAARILRTHAFKDFLIDAGGDLYAGGQNCEGFKWQIGIKDPRDTSEIIDVVHVENAAVATSGDYEQYYEIKGERWSHIINPITGYPPKWTVSSSVIAPTATEADALATALSIMEAQRGIALLDSLGEGYGGLILIGRGKDGILKQKSIQFKKLSKL